MNDIAIMYEFGHGVPKDYDRAMEWYLKAVELGSEAAEYNMQSLIDEMSKK